jgi:hypothetical protein
MKIAYVEDPPPRGCRSRHMSPPMFAAGDGPETGQTAALLIRMLLRIDDFSVVRISGGEPQTNLWRKIYCRTHSSLFKSVSCMHESKPALRFRVIRGLASRAPTCPAISPNPTTTMFSSLLDSQMAHLHQKILHLLRLFFAGKTQFRVMLSNIGVYN